MQRLAERLIEQFQEWEFLGRGDLPVCSDPVRPEPPYRPFLGYGGWNAESVDDGRRPSAIERWVGSSPSSEPSEEESVPEFDFRFSETIATVEVRFHLPKGFERDGVAFQSFLLSLSDCIHPFSFEVFGNSESQHIQFCVSEVDASLVQRQASVWFPEAYVSVQEGGLANALLDDRSERIAAAECRLGNVLHFPVDAGKSDLLAATIASLSEFAEGEVGLLQVLFEPVHNPWARDVLNTVLVDGEPFFADGADLAKASQQKVSKPLFGVVVRYAATASESNRLEQLLQNLVAPLRVTGAQGGNQFEVFFDEDTKEYPDLTSLVERTTRRFGMLLNLDELMHFVHLPSTDSLPHLVDCGIRSRPAPIARDDSASLELGLVHHRGEEHVVRLGHAERVRHTHIIGASGTGKSTLLLNCIRQDMTNGQGVAVLDPHGDLIDAVLKNVPEERAGDVILFDPSDEDFPIGFNVLDAHSEVEKTLLSSDLCSVFRRFSTSWGDQMTAVLSNAILAFLESSEGGTLADLRRFLVDPKFRAQFLATVEDPEIVYFWEHDYKLLSGKPEGSVVTRLNSFLRPKPIRHMVSQRKSKLDFAKVMDGGKILLARIPQGLIGEENAYLLGSLLVIKIHQLVLGRQARDAEARRPFWLYCDEFHHFLTNSMASILSGARKYNLGLILVHQEMRQLESRDRDVASAVLANAHNRIAFRVGDLDAKALEDGFAHYSREDMQNLPTGQALCRIGGAENDFCLSVPWFPSHEGRSEETLAEQIRTHSREAYGIPREELKEVLKPSEAVTEEAAPIEDVERTPSVAEAPVIEDSPSPVSTPGRGGVEHKALQNLVKQVGEGLGFRATIEKTIPGGGGYVDVALEKEGRRVAVEISVTTSVEHELKNARKCLEAGYGLVIIASLDTGRLRSFYDHPFVRANKSQIALTCIEEIASFLQSDSEKPPVMKGFKIVNSFRSGSSREKIRRNISNVLKRVVREQRG